MTSKDIILQSIRTAKSSLVPVLPEIDFDPPHDLDLYSLFCDMLKSVGGEAVTVDPDDLENKVRELYPTAKRIVCNVEGCPLTDEDGTTPTNPHDFSSVDLAVVKGAFAVAENGAVWIRNSKNRHRALYFLAENLAIVVNKNEIVATMHDAYERISFEEQGYGTFISGPSKTADIEQSLVIGAHGPKSAYVLFM